MCVPVLCVIAWWRFVRLIRANPFLPQPEAPAYAHYIRTHDSISPEVDEVSLHQAIAAFYSDFTLMTTALRPHGLSYLSPSLQCASIDHAMYFHKPFRVDDWMLYDMEATISTSSRGLNFGRMWQNGELVCSTSQEGLIRLREIRNAIKYSLLKSTFISRHSCRLFYILKHDLNLIKCAKNNTRFNFSHMA